MALPKGKSFESIKKSLTSSMDTFASNMEDLEEVFKALNDEVEHWEEQHKHDAKLLNDIGPKMKKYKQELDELQGNVANGDFSANASNGNLDEIKSELDAKNNEIKELKDMLDAKALEIREIQKDLKSKDDEISKVIDDLNKKSDESEKWEEKYLNTKNAFKDADDKNKEQVERINERWEQRLSKIENAFKSSDDKNKRNLELKVNKAKAEIITKIFDSFLDVKFGIKGTGEDLINIFSDEGLIEIPTEGAKFDPEKHISLNVEYDENVEEGTILEEYNRGYMLEGIVIRKADVKVCKREEEPVVEENTELIANDNLEFSKDEFILGIDLGLNNIMVAVYNGVNSKLVPSKEGKTLYGKSFYSAVAFRDDEILVGESAKAQIAENSDSGVLEIKSKLGEDIDLYVLDGPISSSLVLANLFRKIKEDAELFLGTSVSKAVFSLPFSFNKVQTKAIYDAATMVGITPVNFIREPFAAALAYGFNNSNSNQNILCYDLEGDRVTVSVIQFGGENPAYRFNSGEFAADKSINDIIVDYLIEEFKDMEGIDLSEDERALSLMNREAERAKIALSNVLSHDVNIAYIALDGDGNPKNLNITLTRDKFEDLVREVVEKTANTILMALDSAKISKNDIDNIILVGGHSRMPIVREFVSEFVGKSAEENIDPMEAIAIGAAIDGFNLISSDIIGL